MPLALTNHCTLVRLADDSFSLSALLAAVADKLAESYRKSGHAAQAAEQEARAAMLRQRVIDLPDPDDELLRYLPSRSVEGTAGGVSHNKALALCRRLVAVELAKLVLWIECHAEGLPLTFLDHRLVMGDSLTGPFFEHLLKYPGSQQPLDDLFTQGLTAKLTAALADALQRNPRYFRLSYRKISASTNERTAIFANISHPGWPQGRPDVRRHWRAQRGRIVAPADRVCRTVPQSDS